MTDPDTSTQDVLVLAQRVAAPPDAVFDFFVDPEKMVRWMGAAVDIEPEPGGKFWLNVNGTDIAAGTYLEVDPPRRVVFTWGWEGSGDVPPGSSTVTVTLTPDGDHTTVDLRHDGLPGGAEDEHGQGWTHYLRRLVDAAEGATRGRTPIEQTKTSQAEPFQPRGRPTVSTIVVRYRPKPDQADENQQLVEAVFTELAATDPGGVRYATFRLGDGTFVHIADIEGDENPLSTNAAFAAFQENIADRCEDGEGPDPQPATLVGSYGLIAP